MPQLYIYTPSISTNDGIGESDLDPLPTMSQPLRPMASQPMRSQHQHSCSTHRQCLNRIRAWRDHAMQDDPWTPLRLLKEAGLPTTLMMRISSSLTPLRHLPQTRRKNCHDRLRLGFSWTTATEKTKEFRSRKSSRHVTLSLLSAAVLSAEPSAHAPYLKFFFNCHDSGDLLHCLRRFESC